MRDDLPAALEEAGELGRVLRSMRTVAAPSSLLSSVMTRIGLADTYFSLETPIGPVFVAYNDQGISAVMPADDATEFEKAFRARTSRAAYRTSDPPAPLRRAITERLQGRGRVDLRFDLRDLSEFEQMVLRKALEIPRGEVRPYAWLAREIGHPRAVRAVGSALARNPIPLLIPCHRVIRSDGAIGQYGLGPENKRVLLTAEGADLAEIDELARRGIRYVGSETTKIYCFPACRNARRITSRHRLAFHSEREAAVEGFRPCMVCRPESLAVRA